MTQRPPESYGDAVAEYVAVRHGVGLLDRSDLGVLEVTGRDRATFLHAMLSNDVKSLSAGQGCAASFLDVHGKVQTLLVVLALDDRILLLTPPGLAAATLEALDKFLFSEKANFRDATGEHAVLVLAGPDALPLIRRLAGTGPAEPAWSHTVGTIEGATVRLVRGPGETGEAEIWVLAAAGGHDALWRAAVGAGARPIGLTAWETLRLEAGTPAFGRDVDSSVLLPEVAGFERLVSYTKGCYIGQEVVVRIRDRGHVNRYLRGLVLEGETVPARDSAVTIDGVDVGRVTSAAWSFGLKRPIALAYIRRQHAEPGTSVAVQIEGRGVPATVSALPFSR